MKKVIIDGIRYELNTETLIASVIKLEIAKYEGDIVIRPQVHHAGMIYNVTMIADYAFFNCSLLTSVTIPDTVTSIGKEAFFHCSSLVTIIIPNNVTNIGSSAFRGCISLSSISIPDGVTNIEKGTFRACSSLKSIALSENVTIIGEGAFEGCRALVHITMPNHVVSIGMNAFLCCRSLSSISIGNSVTRIDLYAFARCKSLTSIVWHAQNCAVIPNPDINFMTYPPYFYPFYYIRTQITSFTFGDRVKHIPACLCFGMENLTSITIPNSVTSIGDRAFEGCSSLATITYLGTTDEWNKISIDNNYSWLSSLKSIHCADGDIKL